MGGWVALMQHVGSCLCLCLFLQPLALCTNVQLTLPADVQSPICHPPSFQPTAAGVAPATAGEGRCGRH